MKQLNKIAAVLLVTFLATNIFAQQPEYKKLIEKVNERFLYNLNVEHSGIVESSIFNIMEVKSKFPNEDYSRLVRKLYELALEGNTPSIRYKAQLASLYFNFYDMFADIKITEVEKENPDLFFHEISNKLMKIPVAVNN
ncbi:hypothetical protein [Melioribacter sp. OK-6-Me]|uniref:hypothetical protein n=1 Tax=unclassified Melioribacter TaxID=2627329 RepID=UPI003ED8D107